MKQYVVDIKALLNSAFVAINSYRKAHAVLSTIILIVVIFVGYKLYSKLTSTAGVTKYMVSYVEKGTLIASVSGSGQVTSTNQVDIKAKVSGTVTRVNVKNGQAVKAGTLLLQIDSRDAQKQVRDAQVSLESAKLSLEKLQKPADVLTLTQAENALEQAKQNKINAQANLQKAYDDGFNTVATTFLDLPSIMNGIDGVQHGYDIDRYSYNIDKYADMAGSDPRTLTYKQDFISSYQKAKISYDATMTEYKQTTRADSKDAIEKLINDTYDTTKTIAEAVKAGNNFLDLVKGTLDASNTNKPAILATHQASMSSYTSKTSSDLLSLLSIKDSIRTSTDAIVNGDRNITEKQASLDNIKNGADALDLKSSELSVIQRQNALYDAQENLSNYYITAPLESTVAKIAFNQLDSVSSGSTIATLITNKSTASISLNEIDIAKIKLGQKATLTFDAVEDLTITGTVVDMDTIGTVTQGVVTYGVKIGFDTNDDAIKPGMSVSASIITDVKTDALLVPNSAISGGFVSVFDPPLVESSSTAQGIPSDTPPIKKQVTLGLSNDTQTEIVSGLKEGDQVVSRIISASTASTQTAPSLLGGLGGNRGGAAATRAVAR